jgi:hypothetical protein
VPFSHYCTRARWALAASGLDYSEVRPPTLDRVQHAVCVTGGVQGFEGGRSLHVDVPTLGPAAVAHFVLVSATTIATTTIATCRDPSSPLSGDVPTCGAHARHGARAGAFSWDPCAAHALARGAGRFGRRCLKFGALLLRPQRLAMLCQAAAACACATHADACKRQTCQVQHLQLCRMPC